MVPIILNPFNHIMISTETDNLMYLLQSASSTKKSSATRFKILYAGPNMLLIILEMVPLTDHIWKNSALFDIIRERYLKADHKIEFCSIC